MHHIKHRGIAFQISLFRCVPKEPSQHSRRSTTLEGVVHWMPNKQNMNDHSFLATHNAKVIAPDLPHCFYTFSTSQSQLTTNPIFVKFSPAKIFPRANCPYMKSYPTLGGTLSLQILFQGKGGSSQFASS